MFFGQNEENQLFQYRVKRPTELKTDSQNKQPKKSGTCAPSQNHWFNCSDIWHEHVSKAPINENQSCQNFF